MPVLRLRLHTQLILAMVVVAGAVTAATLFVVRHSVRSEIQRQTASGMAEAVQAFNRVQREQGTELSRTAALLAELPTLKALIATEHAATVQDASEGFWRTSGEDMLVVTGREGEILGVRADSAAVTRASIAPMLRTFGRREEQRGWWRMGDEVYQVVVQPVVAGSGRDAQALGTIAIGRQMNTTSAEQLARRTGSEIALVAGNTVVASTLKPAEREQLQAALLRGGVGGSIRLAGRDFDAASVPLDTGADAPIHCWVMFSLDAENALLSRLNKTIALLGVLAVVIGVVLTFFISGAITRPVERLMRAVRALASDDYGYAVVPAGSVEMAELANAFNHMRDEVRESQRRRLQAERLAALGRAASSISHDLRHYLAAVLANAEFLREANALGFDRDEIYREIERASAQMTDMIDSMVEIARDRNPIHAAEARLDDVVRRAIDNVHSSPDFRHRNISVLVNVNADGYFDDRKMERAIYNLVRNACEATVNTGNPRVGVDVDGDAATLECRVWDNGGGIPREIERTLFEPFVSAGKSNGTGLGLAIASKIVQDHGGEISIEKLAAGGTAFTIRIPRRVIVAARQDAANLSV